MSLLEHPSVHSASSRLDDLEDASLAWAVDPTQPDVIAVGEHRDVPMVEVSPGVATVGAGRSGGPPHVR